MIDVVAVSQGRSQGKLQYSGRPVAEIGLERWVD